MTCPKCRSHHAKPIERWTLVGRKMTISACAPVGLCESGLSAPVAQRSHHQSHHAHVP